MKRTKTFENNFEETLTLFDKTVRYELEEVLEAKIVDIENNRMVYKDKLVTLLDCKMGCDLGIYSGGSLYFAANRISKVYPNTASFPPNITLRNSRKGRYDNTEIDKLKRLWDQNRNQYYVPMPHIMIFSRVFVEANREYLLDMVIIRTDVLLDFLFDRWKFNLQNMRNRFEAEQVTHLPWLSYRPLLGGIQTNKYDGTTFVYISTNMLDHFKVPYTYRKFPHPDMGFTQEELDFFF